MVIAEFFTSISGLGAIIITSANNFDTATVFVAIVILMVMAIGLNYLIGALERWVAPWQAEIAGRERVTEASAMPPPSLLPREEVGEVDEILVLHGIDDLGHLGIVAASRIVLVAAQRLEQIVLALAGKPGNVLLPGIIGLMTEITVVLLAQRARSFHAGGVGGIGNRLRRRQFRNDVSALLQVGVGEPLGHLVHRFGDAQPVAEHEELHRRVEGRLRAERGCFGKLRCPFFAMAGEAGRQPRVERLCAERERS